MPFAMTPAISLPKPLSTLIHSRLQTILSYTSKQTRLAPGLLRLSILFQLSLDLVDILADMPYLYRQHPLVLGHLLNADLQLLNTLGVTLLAFFAII